MVSIQPHHSTEWVMDRIEPQDEVPEDALSVRELEAL
jgi:hypothetical protein